MIITGRKNAATANWTEDRIAKLTDLWNAGLSCSEIAAELGEGATRNSVIGKVSRLELQPRRNPVDRSKPPMSPEEAHLRKLERQRHYRRTAASSRPPKVRKQRVPRVPKEAFVPVKPKGQAWEPISGLAPVALLDLEAGQCKWPVGQDSPYLFCGAPATHGHYCEHHHAWSVGTGTASERTAIKAAKQATSFERFVPEREVA